MKLISLVLLCSVLLGCQRSTGPIGEAKARSLISDFVNTELSGKTFVDFHNQEHPYPEFKPDHWRLVEFTNGRWVARLDPPAGLWATASVDENGKSPKLEGFGFAPQ